MDNKIADNSYLGTDDVKKLLWKLAVPAVAAQIVNFLYNIVDRIYIGHTPVNGSIALTGLGLCAPIIFVISAFAALIFFGSSAKASISMGAGDYDRAERIMGGSFTLLIVVSLIVTVAVELFATPLLYMFGASDDTVVFAESYIRVYAMGTIFVSLTLGLNAFITAQGFAKVSMKTVLIGAVLNIVLDPLFIFVFKMGVQGAAVATVISQAASTVWVLKFLTGEKTVLRLRKKYFRVDFKLMLPGIALGLSPFIMQATEGLLNICFNSSLQKFGGDTAVGAMTVVSTIASCSWMIMMGFTQGAQPIISFNYGARKPERVRQAFGLLLKICVVFSSAVWLLMMLIPNTLCAAMTDSQELVEYSAWAMRIYAAVMCLMGIQSACQQTFVGIGNAKTSLFLAVLRKIVLLIPLIYIMPLFFENKVMGVFMAEPVADAIAVATTAILFYFQFNKAMKGLECEQ